MNPKNANSNARMALFFFSSFVSNNRWFRFAHYINCVANICRSLSVDYNYQFWCLSFRRVGCVCVCIFFVSFTSWVTITIYNVISASKCFNDVGYKHSTLDMNWRLIKIELNRLIMLRKNTWNPRSECSVKRYIGKRRSINF